MLSQLRKSGEYIGRLEDSKDQNNFIREYTRMMVYLVDQPLAEYIPKLFRLEGLQFIKCFYDTLLDFIDTMDVLDVAELWDRWLNVFLSNRVNGIPIRFLNEEISYIILIATKMARTNNNDLVRDYCAKAGFLNRL